jgi:hypothetical protein
MSRIAGFRTADSSGSGAEPQGEVLLRAGLVCARGWVTPATACPDLSMTAQKAVVAQEIPLTIPGMPVCCGADHEVPL